MPTSERAFLDATLPHLDAVHAVARRLTPTPWHAEDLVQETYLRAFAGFAGHRGESTRAWMMAICVNAARAEWRRKARRPVEVLTDRDDDGDSNRMVGADDVPATVQANLDREAVAAALAQLPEEQRLAIVLMDLGGMTASEVATAVRSPRGTVLARVHRGRRKLARILQAQGVEP